MILSRRIEGNPPLCGDRDDVIRDELMEHLLRAGHATTRSSDRSAGRCLPSADFDGTSDSAGCSATTIVGRPDGALRRSGSKRSWFGPILGLGVRTATTPIDPAYSAIHLERSPTACATHDRVSGK